MNRYRSELRRPGASAACPLGGIRVGVLGALGVLGVLGAGLGGCAEDAPGPRQLVCGAGDGLGPEVGCVWAASGDFRGTGVLSVIEVGEPATEAPSGADEPAVEVGAVAGVVGDDPIVRGFGDTLVIVNRFGGDNVALVDLASRSLIAQISTGPGTNPQDAVIHERTLYVAALGAPGVLVIDLDRPDEGVVATIDLSALDPDDGGPDCQAIERVGGRLYASCGIFDDRFRPRGPGKIAVIEAATEEVVEVLTLSTSNPVGRLQATPADGALGGDLLLATVDFDGLSENDLTRGCLERVAPGGAGEPPAARGCLVANRDLGGYVNAYAYAPEGDTLHLVVTQGYEAGRAMSHLIGFDVQAGDLFDAPATPEDQAPIDVVRCPNGALVMADAAAGGVRVYDLDAAGAGADGGPVFVERTAGALDIGLPPVERGMVCVSGATVSASRSE